MHCSVLGELPHSLMACHDAAESQLPTWLLQCRSQPTSMQDVLRGCIQRGSSSAMQLQWLPAVGPFGLRPDLDQQQGALCFARCQQKWGLYKSCISIPGMSYHNRNACLPPHFR